MSERAKVVIGAIVIFATAPLFLAVAVRLSGAAVVGAGVLAAIMLAVGVYLARPWLVTARRHESSPGSVPEPAGCLPIVVMLVALATGGIIVWFVVFYGAAAMMGGWNV